MKIIFSSRSWADYLYWQSADRDVLDRMNDLIKDSSRQPFTGVGKPEPLRNEMSGWWARRIDQEHRLVYRVTGKGDAQTLEISACRYHYKR